MSVLDRIIPWRRARTQRTWLVGETHAARDTLAASLEQIAQAMEERFAEVMERIDADQAARAEESATTRAQLDAVLSETRRSLETQLANLSSAVETGGADRSFALALRDLKRDIAAQISLGTHDFAAELKEVVAALNRPAGDLSTAEKAREAGAEARIESPKDLAANAGGVRAPSKQVYRRVLGL